VDAFYNIENPARMYPRSTVSSHLKHLSDVQDLGQKMGDLQKLDRLTYKPYRVGEDKRLIRIGAELCLNTYTPPAIKPVKGNIAPFIEFINYLIPDPQEAHQALRWIATLAACPDVHMGWAMLLISEKQGTGKTTLGELFLRPLVGAHNCSIVTSDLIRDGRNAWAGNKRLGMVYELYTEYSQAAYNKIKTAITDKNIKVDEKYVPEYEIENCVHVFANSNSMKALKIENEDRRWFIPRLTETSWPREKWIEFRKWANSGGVAMVYDWAINDWDDYVGEAEEAPGSELKNDIIEDAKSEVMRKAVQAAAEIAKHPAPVVVNSNDLISAIIQSSMRTGDTHLLVLREMTKRSGLVFDLGYALDNGRKVKMVCNKEALELYRKESARPGWTDKSTNGGDRRAKDYKPSDRNLFIKAHLRSFNEFMPKAAGSEKGM
jgi:hypothetical protein